MLSLAAALFASAGLTSCQTSFSVAFVNGCSSTIEYRDESVPPDSATWRALEIGETSGTSGYPEDFEGLYVQVRANGEEEFAQASVLVDEMSEPGGDVDADAVYVIEGVLCPRQ
jgi:hypothetical protein